MTQAVIDAVNKLGKRQSTGKSFKIESRVDIPIIPADWIEGVDYDIYQNDDENSDDSDSDDDSYDPEDDSDSDDDFSDYDGDVDDEIWEITKEQVLNPRSVNPTNTHVEPAVAVDDSDSDESSNDEADEQQAQPEPDANDIEEDEPRPVFEDETIGSQRPQREVTAP